MKNDYELMTVREYVQDLKENGYNSNPIMSAQDYAKNLRAQCVKFQSHSLMTVDDYVKTLDSGRYMTPMEAEIENKVNESLSSKKAEINAQIVEDLLA